VVDDLEGGVVRGERVLTGRQLPQPSGGPLHQILHGFREQPTLEAIGLQHLAERVRHLRFLAQRVDLAPGSIDPRQFLLHMDDVADGGGVGDGEQVRDLFHRAHGFVDELADPLAEGSEAGSACRFRGRPPLPAVA
jgi:hypothetical protein